jgi:hypothetical protein
MHGYQADKFVYGVNAVAFVLDLPWHEKMMSPPLARLLCDIKSKLIVSVDDKLSLCITSWKHPKYYGGRYGEHGLSRTWLGMLGD